MSFDLYQAETADRIGRMAPVRDPEEIGRAHV